MRLPHLLALLAALFFFPAAARAETDSSSSTTQTEQQQNDNKDNRQDSTETGRTTARKEDEDEATSRANMFARIKAWGTGKTALADNIAELQSQLKAANARADAAETKVTDLTAENETMRADLQAFAAFLEHNPHAALTDPASEPGKAAAAAVGAGVAAEVRKIGVKTADVKPKKAVATATGVASAAEVPAFGTPGFAAISSNYWENRQTSPSSN